MSASSCAMSTTPTVRSTTSRGSATKGATSSGSCRIRNGRATACSARTTGSRCCAPSSARPADPGQLQHVGGNSLLTPHLVGDPTALAVGLGHRDERLLDVGEVDLAPEAGELGLEVAALLSQVERL